MFLKKQGPLSWLGELTVVFALVVQFGFCGFSAASESEIKIPEFVAHAGGGVYGLDYTNSLEAFEFNYQRGLRFFETDFEWTNDSQIVLLHDWDQSLKRLFSAQPGIYSLKEFKNFVMICGLTQMSLEDLARWLDMRTDVFIITDVKSDNLKALRKIAKSYPNLKDRLIPQIYRFAEYGQVKKMGFGRIILTLYVMHYKDASVIDFIKGHRVWALTMLLERANTNFITNLKIAGVGIFVHTINDVATKEKLRSLGVDGIYTDTLAPSLREGGSP